MGVSEARYKFLFVVETKSKNHDSDYVYIRKILNDIYHFSESGHKLEPIYCGGKGNVMNQEKKIAAAIKSYTGKSTIVFVCVDIDTPQKRDSYELNPKIYNYCIKNNFHFVWFKEDSERVILEREIPDSQKVESARKFSSNGKVNEALLKRMSMPTESFETANNHTSNLITVIDEIDL